MSIEASSIRVPEEFSGNSEIYRAIYLREWEKDYNAEFKKYAIFSWLIPLIILLGMILAVITEQGYLPQIGLKNSLIAGISWTTALVGIGGAIGVGIKITRSANVWVLWGYTSLDELNSWSTTRYNEEVAARDFCIAKRNVVVAEATRQAMIKVRTPRG